MKCLHAFGINRHKCKAGVSFLCQYICAATRNMWNSFIVSCSTGNLQLTVSVMHIDFEISIYTVFKEIFPVAAIK